MKTEASRGLERVLVTGAGGFIGARVAEVLHLTGRARVRAGIHRWAGAARVGRLPVEIVACDVLDPRQVRAAVGGADAVVHCAYGSGDVNVTGTQHVLDAARDAGVRRVVHLSTIDVYGRPAGDVDESSPRRKGFGEYGDSKIDAEEVCRAHVEDGTPVVVLRPTIVYGPFSANWTIRYAQLLASERWSLPTGYGSGICNLVYVDDLVRAILLSLDRDAAVGQTFNVNGPERPTWRAYLEAFATATGLPPVRVRSPAVTRARAMAVEPIRMGAKLALRRFPGLLRMLYHGSPAARRAMDRAETTVRTTTSGDECRFYERTGFYTIEKARSSLGFEPRVTMSQGLHLSTAWLRHHGYLERAAHA